ncbi:MAG: hypothetical protein HZA52_03620 [Planctomycetes bacterium]|nr:hypothetical protein [Planctomycetota bacterium]
MRAHVLFAAGVLALAVSAGAGEPSASDVEVRSECFALELETQVEGSPQHVGIAKLTRASVGADTLLEWDLFFATENVRVLHVERFGADGAKLVWRELSSGRGRTVLAELGVDATTLRVVDWSSEREREDVHVDAECLLPLAHLELARRGELCDGLQRVFDPLTRALEPLATETRFEAVPLDEGDGLESWQLEREVSSVRADGTHAWSARFVGDELRLYRWQAGGLVARRIESGDYERELESLAPDVGESPTPPTSLAHVKSE